MKNDKVSVLIVDDSSFMRLVIRDMLSNQEDIHVIDTAENGKEAVEKTLSLRPDIVLLDLLMEDYDGFYAIKEIMRQQPTPIMVLSSAGTDNKQVVFDALKMGAIDFLNKPEKGKNAKIRDIADELIYKIKEAPKLDKRKLVPHVNTKENHNIHTFSFPLPYEVILIGASTGGPSVVEDILSKLPSNLPIPVVVVQHIPDNFVEPFARRLSNVLPLDVQIAFDQTPLKGNIIFICNTSYNLEILKGRTECYFQRTDKLESAYNFPSINSVFKSASNCFKEKTIGVVLSGMGTDGTEGLLKIKEHKGLTLCQSEGTSVVYGMPRSAIEAGAVHYELPGNEIAQFIITNF